MTTPREPDSIIAVWLEDGPNDLPESTRRAIAVATRTTTQHRRPMWTLWRSSLMNPLSKVAFAALAVIAIVGGGIFLLSPSNQVAGPSPAAPPSAVPASPPASSSPPSPAPQGAVPTDWTTYTSTRFGYSIDHPTDWVVVPAESDWVFGALHPDGNNLDRFHATPTGTRVLVSSTDTTMGLTSEERIAELDSVNLPCQLSDRHAVTIDGAAARQEDFFCFGVDYGIELVFANASRHFQVDLFSKTPLGETDRATFERFLESFRFGDIAASSPTVTIDQSTEDGYSISVPQSWNYRTYPNGLFFSPPASITAAAVWVGPKTAGQYSIDVGEAYGGSPYAINGAGVAELLASVNATYIALNSTEATAEREVTIDGEPAWVTEHLTPQPATLLIDAVVIHGDRAYNLTMDAPPEHEAELRAAFAQIMASIRWSN